MLWKRNENDALGIYYLAMDKVQNGYAANDLVQARTALSQAFLFAPVNNPSYVQYWDCLLGAREQLRDSVITMSDFFQQMDFCNSIASSGRVTAKAEAPKATEANLLKLYPNPANDQVKVSYFLKKTEPVTIELVDLNGVVLQTIQKRESVAGNQEVSLTISNRKTGLYFIQVYGKHHYQAARFSILK